MKRLLPSSTFNLLKFNLKSEQEPIDSFIFLLKNNWFQQVITLTKYKILSKHSQFQSLFQLYQFLFASSPLIFSSVSTILITICAQLKLPNPAIEIITNIAENQHLLPSLASINLILKVLVSRRPYNDTFLLFSKIKSLGVQLDVFAYNKAMQLYVKSNDVDRALSLFEEIEKVVGVIPDRFSYNILIAGSWKVKRGDHVEKLFDEISERGALTNEVIYNGMIDGYCKDGKMDVAFRVAF